MRIVFIGAGKIGVPTLQALLKSEHHIAAVVTQSDKPIGRAHFVEPPPIKKALMSGAPYASPARTGRALPILQPARMKDQHAIDEIRTLGPDVIVVVAYGQILSREVLEIPMIACLNLHASLLPRWRGAAPIQAAIGAGDRETGITVMCMDEGLDTGDILLQRKIEIAPDETGASLHDKLAQIAPEALAEAILLLQKGKATRVPQEDDLAIYAPKLEREHGRIDWTESAAVIERKIRAFDPWPGAFMGIDHRNLKIFAATIVDRSGKPGQISRNENELIVAAGEGALSLGEFQLEGKRRMSAAEFLRGHSWIARP